MAFKPMAFGAKTIQQRKENLDSRQSAWIMYAPFLALILAVGPAVVALRERGATKKKEKEDIARTWTKWHLISAVVGASAALVPAYFSYEELKIKRLEKGMGV